MIQLISMLMFEISRHKDIIKKKRLLSSQGSFFFFVVCFNEHSAVLLIFFSYTRRYLNLSGTSMSGLPVNSPFENGPTRIRLTPFSV